MMYKIAMFDYANQAIAQAAPHLNLTPEQTELVQKYAIEDFDASAAAK